MSRAAEQLLGYRQEECVNRSAFQFIHDEDVARVREGLARAKESDAPVTCEFRVRHKNGSLRQIEAVAVDRGGDAAVGGIIVNYRDVSARAGAPHPAAAGEERLRHLFDTAQDLIYYSGADGCFTYVNPAASRVMKYAPHELIGRHFLTLIRPDYRAAAAALYERQARDKTPTTYFEFPAVAADGQVVWVGQHVQIVVEDDRVVGFEAIARDITRQHDAEERLRRSEARYRSFVQNAAYGICSTTKDGRIVDANPAFARMLGYDSVDEVRAVNMDAIYFPPNPRPALVAAHLKEGGTRSGDVKWRKKDGTPIIVRLTARLVGDGTEAQNGRDAEPHFECIVEDITEKRALEDQLRQAQKMEAVGRLARGIAHDFNNVLAAILGCSDLMQYRLKPGDPTLEDALEIGKAAERGAALTKQLLAFSRREAADAKVLDVHAVVRGFNSMLQRLKGPVELRLHTPGPPPLVRIEPGQIEQVVLNLVVNARDASAEGGGIDVFVEAVDLDAARYPGMPQGRYARIAVKDTGIGMDAEVQRHVFEPFFTTKAPEKGTGLGLSIVYSIAKEAGGTVSFSSAPNKGTTFEVLLPVVSP